MNVRLAKPFGVRVGELVDRLEALSYRHGRPQFAISYCIVPAQRFPKVVLMPSGVV